MKQPDLGSPKYRINDFLCSVMLHRDRIRTIFVPINMPITRIKKINVNTNGNWQEFILTN